MLDTNVFISFMLNPRGAGPPQQVVRRTLAGEATVIVNQLLLEEVVGTATRKPSIAQRIDQTALAWLSESIEQLAAPAEVPADIPSVFRDRNDDYLIALALLERVDYLVSGDKDLLVLEQVANTRIVSPTAFLALLDQASS